MEAILYSVTFIIFFGLAFYSLRASRLEEAFKKGRVFEIRLAYFLISLVVGVAASELLYRIFSLTGASL
ncbi:MAG: DUF1146 domain-containing protein [Acholeplasmatales bacterium]|nr:DUF1146 domain-containing protein [Acholeplasmatales bacterium]MCR5786562.1 DUF1146 domain-containing protein [Acholeplasmatales bacterium]